MAKSPKLNLELTSKTETGKKWLDYVEGMSGNTQNSNMMKIDTAIGNLRDAVSHTSDKISSLGEELTGSIADLQKSIASPFQHKGTVESLTELNNISNPKQNDTYYVIGEGSNYTYNGSTWTQSSMKETQYAGQVNTMNNQVVAVGSETFDAYVSSGFALYNTGIDPTNGHNTATTNYIRRTDYLSLSDDRMIIIDPQYELLAWTYEGKAVGTKVFSPTGGQYVANQPVIIRKHDNANYFRVAIRRVDQAEITEDDEYNIQNSLVALGHRDRDLSVAYAKVYAQAERTYQETDHCLTELPLVYDSYMRSYNPQKDNGAGNPSGRTISSTDFIQVSGNRTDEEGNRVSDIYVAMEIDENNSSAQTAGTCYITIQFYDQNKQFVNDIWVRTTDHNHNRIYYNQSDQRQFTIPDGYYIKVHKGTAKNVRIFQWNGNHFGVPISATSRVTEIKEVTKNIKDTTTSKTVSLPQEIYLSGTGKFAVTIPSNSKYIFCANGYKILNVYGIRAGTDAWNNTSQTLEERCTTWANLGDHFPVQMFTIDKNILYKSSSTGRPYVYSYYRVVLAKNYTRTRNDDGVYEENYDRDYVMGEGDRIVSVYTESPIAKINEDVSEGRYETTRSSRAIYKAKILNEITWACKRSRPPAEPATSDADDDADPSGNFIEGITYHGIPYGTIWIRPHFIGWHVSSLTFANATNDPDSIFYLENASGDPATGGPYYSLVCSSYATLAAGFYYPQTNYGFLNDPNYGVYRANTPIVGQVTTNGYGHAYIAGGLYADETYDGSGYKKYYSNVYESITPLCQRRTFFSDIAKVRAVAGNHSEYQRPYSFNVTFDSRLPEAGFPYTVSATNTITNGTARPYRGNQSVYTSNDPIIINIKDANARQLIIAEYHFDDENNQWFVEPDPAKWIKVEIGDTEHPVTTTATVCDLNNHNNTTVINLEGRQITLKKGDLPNCPDVSEGNAYAIWTDIDDTPEYFEYYNLTGMVVMARHSLPDEKYTYKGDVTLTKSTYKGKVSLTSELPTDNNEIDDTYYVQEEKDYVTWTGERWEKNSTYNTDYTNVYEALSAIPTKDLNVNDVYWVRASWTKGGCLNYYVECINENEQGVKSAVWKPIEEYDNLIFEIRNEKGEIIDHPWWYTFVEMQSRKRRFYTQSNKKDGAGMSIWYDADGDYSGYVEKARFHGGNRVFCKGKFGAYVINGTNA